MSYLIFDTETTGFPSKDLESSHPKQAHIVQLACLKLDAQFNEVASFYTLIKPDYFKEISLGASQAHGITLEQCHCYGMPIGLALNVFFAMLKDTCFIAAHNLKFDKQMISIDYGRLIGGVPMLTWSNSSICTMECTTDICALPPKFPGTKYKWPKLQEAYEFLFKETFAKAHDALADVRATARILRWLIENKKVA